MPPMRHQNAMPGRVFYRQKPPLSSCLESGGLWFALSSGMCREKPGYTILTLPFVARNTISSERIVVTVRMVASAPAVPSLMRVTS